MYLRICNPSTLPTSVNGKVPESNDTPLWISLIKIIPMAFASSTTSFLIRLEIVGSSSTQTTILPAVFFGSKDPGRQFLQFNMKRTCNSQDDGKKRRPFWRDYNCNCHCIYLREAVEQRSGIILVVVLASNYLRLAI